VGARRGASICRDGSSESSHVGRARGRASGVAAVVGVFGAVAHRYRSTKQMMAVRAIIAFVKSDVGLGTGHFVWKLHS
jgi:hypothetical protein